MRLRISEDLSARVCSTEYGKPKESPLDSVDDISLENLTVEDKTELEEVKSAVEQEIDDNGTEYSQEELKELENRLEEITDLIEIIENAEEMEETINSPPDKVSPDDTEAEKQINAAREQYDALSEYENKPVSDEAVEKLESLLTQLADYRIIVGDNSTWTKGSDRGLTFIANGAYSKFTGIEIDRTALDTENYAAESGSTVITLKPDYMNTLTEEKHTITVFYTDGERKERLRL